MADTYREALKILVARGFFIESSNTSIINGVEFRNCVLENTDGTASVLFGMDGVLKSCSFEQGFFYRKYEFGGDDVDAFMHRSIKDFVAGP